MGIGRIGEAIGKNRVGLLTDDSGHRRETSLRRDILLHRGEEIIENGHELIGPSLLSAAVVVERFFATVVNALHAFEEHLS
jgi:hypothetical protein